MSDIVLKIDADTARYIAKIAQMAEATKGVAKPVKEANELWEAGVEIVGRKIMKLTAVGAAVEVIRAGAEGVTEIYDHWIERLNEAHKAMERITQAGKGAVGGTAQGPGAARGALMNLDSQLSNEQRFSAFAAYRQAHPGATTEQGVAAVQAASEADKGGLNATEFAGSLGKLRGLGDNAKDIAALALGRGGAQGSGIVDLLSEITAKSGAAQAKAALPLALSAASTVGGLDVLKQGYSAFSSQGRQGSFADTFQNNGLSLVPGLATRKTMQDINAGVGKNQFTNGYFGAIAGSGEGDPLNALDIANRRYAADEENFNVRVNGASAIRKMATKEFQETYDKNSVMNPMFSKNANELLQRSGYYDNDPNHAISAAARHATEQREIAAKLEEQNEMMRNQKSPAIGTQGEGGP